MCFDPPNLKTWFRSKAKNIQNQLLSFQCRLVSLPIPFSFQDELRELVTLCGGHVISSPRRASVRVGRLLTSQSWPTVKEAWVLGLYDALL